MEYETVLDVERRLLLDNDPATLATRASIALLLVDRGRNAEAAQVRDEVYAAQCAVLGPDHPETRATRDGHLHRATRPGPL